MRCLNGFIDSEIVMKRSLMIHLFGIILIVRIEIDLHACRRIMWILLGRISHLIGFLWYVVR